MIKVIATVGTSLFTNYMRKEVQEFVKNKENSNIDAGYKAMLKEQGGRVADSVKTAIDKYWVKDIKTSVDTEGDLKCESATGLNTHCCAEVQSLVKIQQEQNTSIDAYLLATDTELSKLACQIIKNVFDSNENYNVKIHYNEEVDTIKGLKVNNSNSFKDGLNCLLTRFYKICEGYFENVILNVTGGYKGLIPFLTILGQANKIPIKYIYEDTAVLHTIPALPITINEQLFEKHYSTFLLLEKEILDKNKHYEFTQDLNGCIDIDGNDFSLNSLGDILWKRYKSDFFFFYTIDSIWSKIETNEKIYNALKNNFSKSDIREGHTEMKPSNNKVHRCYDGGRTNPRMFYFIDNGKVYLYETFESHNQEYEGYLNKLNSISMFTIKDSFKSATLRKISIA